MWPFVGRFRPLLSGKRLFERPFMWPFVGRFRPLLSGSVSLTVINSGLETHDIVLLKVTTISNKLEYNATIFKYFRVENPFENLF
jgi:hypothetical protein